MAPPAAGGAVAGCTVVGGATGSAGDAGVVAAAAGCAGTMERGAAGVVAGIGGSGAVGDGDGAGAFWPCAKWVMTKNEQVRAVRRRCMNK